VTAAVRQAVEQARRAQAGAELVLGRFDGDGRVLSRFGVLPLLPMVPLPAADPRRRFQLEIVLAGDAVLVRKDFGGDRARFLSEWLSLAVLGGRANVPAVFRVDEPRCVLYKNLVPGPTVRQLLAEAGAEILQVQTREDPALRALPAAERVEAVAARGARLIPRCLPETVLQQMEAQLDAMHAAGVTGVSLTFGNVVLDADSGEPWFIDTEGSELHARRDRLRFRYRRDQDRSKFNRLYGRSLVTEVSARRLLRQQLAGAPESYAPIDFGQGLTHGGFWSVDSGSGRWEYLNRRVVAPLVAGRRVLDLGSNNGILPLLMLRAGAREVVGVELAQPLAERARLVHRLFEWRDLRRYAFTVHQADMRSVLHADWGRFDLVTAFCSLYYLPEEDMARVVRRAAQLAGLIAVQAKEDTRRQAAERKAEKSSAAFLSRLLRENGFPRIETHRPRGYSRPLLVGRAD
jgi:SAM-dependent methyltransferase